MAVYAAHLTRTLQGTPSVFQVTAQEALGATVKPALRKLIEYVSSVYPNKCGWCEKWYDELYLLFDYYLQYHYLKHYAASFSECFYELMRVPITTSEEFHHGSRLPPALEKGSLALLVLLPYLRDKFEKIVNCWREKYEDGQLGKSKTARAKIAAIHIYSTIHLVSEACKLVVLARYLTGRSRSPTPSLLLLGLTLADAPPQKPEENTWGDLFRSIFKGQFDDAVVTFPMVWSLVSVAAGWGAFGLQLLRWLDSRPRLALDLPPPPPPQRDEKSIQYMNKCPVCLQPWKVPTVLPVSGFVFCYGCVSRAVRAAGACPVTSLPAAPADLVRLYAEL